MNEQRVQGARRETNIPVEREGSECIVPDTAPPDLLASIAAEKGKDSPEFLPNQLLPLPFCIWENVGGDPVQTER